VVYDDRSLMTSPKELPGAPYSLKLKAKDDDGKEDEFELNIRKVADFAIDQVENFFQGSTTESPKELIMAWDLVLRHSPSRKFVAVGSSFYRPDGSQPLGEGCSAWRGFYQSIRPTQSFMTVNLDENYTAFYDEQPLVELCCQILGESGGGGGRGGRGGGRGGDRGRGGRGGGFGGPSGPILVPHDLGPAQTQKLKENLRGVRFRTKHTGQQISYVIEGLGRSALNEEFDVDGRKVSVAQYFREKYQIGLKYPNWPVIKAKRGRVMIPAELCFIPQHRRNNLLSPQMTATMIRVAATRPDLRLRGASEAHRIANFAQDDFAKAYGIQVNNQPIAVNGRVINAPRVLYGDSKESQPSKGSWQARGVKALTPGDSITSWGVASFCDERDAPNPAILNFVGNLIRTGRELGLKISDRPPIERIRPNAATAASDLEKFRVSLDRTSRGPPTQFLLVIKRDQEGSLYNAIKRWGDCLTGITTQVMLSKHIGEQNPNRARQYCENLLLKINAKMNGRNFAASPYTEQSLRLPFETAPFMVLGADVTHPPPGVKKFPSIAAMIGSMDRWMARHVGTYRSQDSTQEILVSVQDMFHELVSRFTHENRGIRPRSIIMLRDGVSEGQFREVMNREVWSLREACIKIDPNYKPRMTYAVVQKRHHTRLCPVDRNECDKSGNAPAGTVVDTEICHPREFDFYLYSHAGLQGTSRPAHYHVLHDENQLTADQMQHFAFRLCHSYARVARSVSLPPATYYAHLLAFRARCFVESDEENTSQASSGSSGSALNVARVHDTMRGRMYFV